MTIFSGLVRLDTELITLAQCSAGALLALHGLCEQQGESRIFNSHDLRELLGYGALSCIMERFAPENDQEGAIHYFNRAYKESGFALDDYSDFIPGWSIFNQGDLSLRKYYPLVYSVTDLFYFSWPLGSRAGRFAHWPEALSSAVGHALRRLMDSTLVRSEFSKNKTF